MFTVKWRTNQTRPMPTFYTTKSTSSGQIILINVAISDMKFCRLLQRNKELGIHSVNDLRCLKWSLISCNNAQGRLLHSATKYNWTGERGSRWRSRLVMGKPKIISLIPQRALSTKIHGSLNRCFIALGSNMGGRLRPIEAACRAIDRIPDTKIVRTSGLWNTKAMYVTNQEDFLNGVCEVGVF